MVDGDRSLARTIYEVMVDAINFPFFHTRNTRCDHIRLMHRTLTVAPSFQHLLDMNILVALRPLVGNGLEYGLLPQFAATTPEPPCFNVPEPILRYMYAELNKTSSDDLSEDDQ